MTATTSNTIVNDLKKALDAPKKHSLALILSPVGIILLSAARLIIVANYNTTTAVTIASSGGYINAFLGSVIPLVPVFAPYLALLFLLLRRWLLSLIVFLFAAFITPTSMSLPQIQDFANVKWRQLATEWHHLVAALFGNWEIVPVVVLVILGVVIIRPLWAYHRSFAEAASAAVFIVVLAALVFPTPNEGMSIPVKLRLASSSEGRGAHQLVTFATGHGYEVLIIAIGLALFILFCFRSMLPHIMATAIAVGATIALFPYIHNIYPLPQNSSYYSEVLHELWMPAEKLVTHSGHVYYGYILSSDPAWYTVLLIDRTIVYLPAGEVVARSVCQPQTNLEPAVYRPLVPWLYTKPSPTPVCAPTPSSLTTIPSILSHGQSLKEISAKVHTWPWHIISITNAIERGRPSAPLRRYESKHNWNAPTPRGQRFWYNPPITRQSTGKTRGPTLVRTTNR